MSSPAPVAIRLLVVCTANQCRSPMAAAFLARALGAHAVVSSAGTAAAPGAPVTSDTLMVMATRGFNLAGHTARLVSEELVIRSDLVLTMERQHTFEIISSHPQFFGRTFTIGEFVERATLSGPRADSQPLEQYLSQMNYGRSPSELLSNPVGEDLPDPFGRGRDHHRRAADGLEKLCQAVADALLG